MTDFPLSAIDLSARPRPRPLAILCGPIAWVIGPVTLGLALQVNYGQFHPLALRWLTVSLLACFAGVIGLCSRATSPTASAVLLPRFLGAALAFQFIVILTGSPTATMVIRSPGDLLPFQIGVVVAAGFSALALTGRAPRLALFGLLAVHFLLGFWILRTTPPPPVDVCLFQHDACQALLGGHNPYAMTFPQPYADPARVYAPGTFANGRLLFGYPYPPISLLLVLPGYMVGDFRYAHLVATTLAGALIALARPGRVATMAAALFLFTPRGFFVLEAGWTEPLVVLMLAAVIFASCRGLKATPILFGLLLVTKQYLVLAAPLAIFIFLRRPSRAGRALPVIASSGGQSPADAEPCEARTAGHSAVRRALPALHGAGRPRLIRWVGVLAYPRVSRPRRIGGQWAHPTQESKSCRGILIPRMCLLAAVALPLLVSMPLIFWNFPAFMHSAVLLQFHQPLRMDALSYSPWLLMQTGIHLPMWLPFVAAAGVIALFLRQRSRTPAALAAGIATTFLIFFSLNKQAFCNYYFFVIGAMCCALAACGADARDEDSSKEPAKLR